MGLHVQDGGVRKSAKNIYVRDAGRWKPLTGGWVKDGGAWKQFWPPAAVVLRSAWLGLEADQPVLVVEGKVDVTMMAPRTAFVYELELRIAGQPLHTLQWRNGELPEWDTLESNGSQSAAMNSALSGDSALPPALKAALQAVPCKAVLSGSQLRAAAPKHYGALVFDDLGVTVCKGGMARLGVSIDNGTTWYKSAWETIDTYVDYSTKAIAIARDDEQAPNYVPRISYQGSALDYIPENQLPYVRMGWEVWTSAASVPQVGGERASCIELSAPAPLKRTASYADHYTYTTSGRGLKTRQYAWAEKASAQAGFMLAAPYAPNARGMSVGQSWWEGYSDGRTDRLHPCNILRSKVYDELIASQNGRVVIGRENWLTQGTYWRFVLVDETPGKKIVHHFSDVVHFSTPALRATHPVLELNSDARVRVVKQPLLPALTASNVRLPGRETPLAVNPSFWEKDDAWTLYCDNYEGLAYGPLRDGMVLQWGNDVLPLCRQLITSTGRDGSSLDVFTDTIFPIGAIVYTASNWALELPGFESVVNAPSGGASKIYLHRAALGGYTTVVAPALPPVVDPNPPSNPFVIVRHPHLIYQGAAIVDDPAVEAAVSGGVQPVTWGDFIWQRSTDSQSTWQNLSGTTVDEFDWVRLTITATDGAGVRLQLISNALQAKPNPLEWAQLPTLVTTLESGSYISRITQYSYQGGVAPYQDSRKFEMRQPGGTWHERTGQVTGAWEIRAIVTVVSSDGQSLQYTTNVNSFDAGTGQDSIGVYPYIIDQGLIRVEKAGDLVNLKCLTPASVSIPPNSTYWYISEYRLSNGAVLARYDSRTDQQTSGDIKGYTHGTAQLVTDFTVTTQTWGVVQLTAASNTVEYDLRVYTAPSGGGTLDCSGITDRNALAVCIAIRDGMRRAGY